MATEKQINDRADKLVEHVLDENGLLPTFGDAASGKFNVTSQLMAYEDGELDDEQTIELFQHLLDSGMIHHLQGAYGRMAQQMINNGDIAVK